MAIDELYQRLTAKGLYVTLPLIRQWSDEDRTAIENWLNGGVMPWWVSALDYDNVIPVDAPKAQSTQETVKPIKVKPIQRTLW